MTATSNCRQHRIDPWKVCPVYRIRFLLSAAIVTAFVAVTCPPAWPQVPQGLAQGQVWPELTAGDLDYIHAAVTRLYRGHAIGATEHWSNPGTRNAGSITFVRSFEIKGMPCRTFDYDIKFAERTGDTNRYKLNWCRTGDHKWQIVEPGTSS